MNAASKSITYSLAQELAHRVPCDWRTILRVARGEPVRGRAGLRAAEALRAAGLLSDAKDGSP